MPVTSCSPDHGGPAGGYQIAIFGSGFTGATSATVDGLPCTGFGFINDGFVFATFPAHALGGPYTVTVNVGGSGVGVFTYAIQVDSVTPNVGGPSGCAGVQIVGSGFTGATQVTFGG